MKEKIINLPELPVTEEYSVTFILDFYESLGWQKDIPINPTNIIINTDQWLEICNHFKTEDGVNNKYLWMNVGPSADANIPYGKVKIIDDAIPDVFGTF